MCSRLGVRAPGKGLKWGQRTSMSSLPLSWRWSRANLYARRLMTLLICVFASFLSRLTLSSSWSLRSAVLLVENRRASFVPFEAHSPYTICNFPGRYMECCLHLCSFQQDAWQSPACVIICSNPTNCIIWSHSFVLGLIDPCLSILLPFFVITMLAIKLLPIHFPESIDEVYGDMSCKIFLPSALVHPYYQTM